MTAETSRHSIHTLGHTHYPRVPDCIIHIHTTYYIVLSVYCVYVLRSNDETPPQEEEETSGPDQPTSDLKLGCSSASEPSLDLGFNK